MPDNNSFPLLGLIVIIVIFIYSRREKKKAVKQAEQESQKLLQFTDSVCAGLGNPNYIFRVNYGSKDAEVRFFIEQEKIFICDKLYNFENIHSVSISDDSEVIEQREKLNVLARGAGGTRRALEKPTHQRTRHAFHIWIYFNDISEPVKDILVGNDENTARQLMHILEMIIEKNKA